MKLITLAFIATHSLGAPAIAKNVTSAEPRTIVDAMQTLGYRAELTTDKIGDPLIKSSAGGATLTIYFYGCTDAKDCQSILLAAAFDMPKGSSIQLINDWNSEKRFAKAYLDEEDDPFLEYDINLSNGGVSPENFASTMETWDKLVADFKTHIDF